MMLLLQSTRKYFHLKSKEHLSLVSSPLYLKHAVEQTEPAEKMLRLSVTSNSAKTKCI